MLPGIGKTSPNAKLFKSLSLLTVGCETQGVSLEDLLDIITVFRGVALGKGLDQKASVSSMG